MSILDNVSVSPDMWDERVYLRDEALPFQRSRKPSPSRDRTIMRLEQRLAALDATP